MHDRARQIEISGYYPRLSKFYLFSNPARREVVELDTFIYFFLV